MALVSRAQTRFVAIEHHQHGRHDHLVEDQSGNSSREFTGVAPSGRNLTWRDMVVTRFAGGKVAEEWVVSDLSAQLLAL